jgi:hypothetical protein
VLPHSYSESVVPFCDTDEGEYLIILLRQVWLKRVDLKSMPTFIASYPRLFLQREHYTPNILFVSRPVGRRFRQLPRIKFLFKFIEFDYL